MSECEELNLTIHGVNTRVLKGGSGPDLLYWHGAGGGGSWIQHHALLAEHFTVFAPDHPGWGGSDGPEWMDAIQDYVLHYDSLIRELKLETPLLVGHSLGGWMAAEYAVTYPDRIRALTLVNAAGFPFDNETAGDAQAPDFFAMASRGGPAFAKLLFHNRDAAAAYFVAEPSPEDILRRYREQTSTARIAWHTWFEPKLPRRLSRISTPTLVLWGAHDGIMPPAFAHKYVAAITSAKLEILEDCGHMVPFENPEALCRSVLELHREAS
jgi:pimeloyl-ACP methyl ester carboxylesterase